MMRALPVLLSIVSLTSAAAEERVLTLDEAVKTAQEHQPQLRQAQASTSAARARVDESRSGMLPQVNVTSVYGRSVSNTGAVAGVSGSTTGGFGTAGRFTLGASASQLLLDFGATSNRWRASKQSAEAQAANEVEVLQQVLLNVRSAYFNVLSQQALVKVARETLASEDARLQQVSAFVEVGTSPEIDLLTERTARANAQVQLVRQQGLYVTAKAQLNQAMGVEGPTDYSVQDVAVPSVQGEDEALEALVDRALKARPDLAASERQIEAQLYSLAATRGGYWPRFTATVSSTNVGPDPTQLTWNLSGQLGLNWAIYEGGLTQAQVREQRALVNNLQAQRDTLRQQVRLQVEQAQQGVVTSREALTAAQDANVSAQAQLRLAQGRYQTGVGNIIELTQAQVAATNAAAQQVQAVYSLASARAQLIQALGRAE